MKGLASMSEAERNEAIRQMRGVLAKSRATLGFYVQLLLVAAAVVAIAANGAWRVLWTLLVPAVTMVLFISKPFVWAWTEKRLRDDAIAGRPRRAVAWDYFAHFFNWLVTVLGFALAAFAAFFLAEGYAMPCPLLWICVGGMYVVPRVFMMENPRDYWGHYLFFVQWTLLATVALSAFAPVGPWLGVAAQVAVGFVSVPLGCRWKKASIVSKVDYYARSAKAAPGRNREPELIPSESRIEELATATWAEVRVRRGPFAVSLLSLVAGVAWMLVHGRLGPLLLALAALPLGYLQMCTTDEPFLSDSGELAKRGVDKDLVRGSAELRALTLTLSLALASTAILWLGGRDVPALVALSLLALGSCTITHFVRLGEREETCDPFVLVAYAAAFASVVALRAAGLAWWECLLPLPAIGYALPALRHVFPRSGLRGEARKAAIAAAEAFEKDPRSDAEKVCDAKKEKRRLRNERRLSNFRRSRGER